MHSSNKEQTWFKPWTKKTILPAIICFLLLACINGLFSFLFDVLLFENEIGYVYFYFSIIFFNLILYYFYTRYRVNWLGTFSFGLMGLIGIGIELWLEYYTNPVLKGTWAAIAWGGIYILYGLVADVSLFLIKTLKEEHRAVLLSASIFSLSLILLSIIPLKLFYIPAPTGTKNFLTFWYFLIPYGIIQGIIGSYTGYSLANKLTVES